MTATPAKYKPVLLPPRGDAARPLALGVMAAAPLLYGLLALYLGADASWDLRNYHWYNAYAYLNGRVDGGLDFLPSQSQFFLNPWLDVPFYLLATHVPLKFAFFILGAVQGLNFPLLFMLAHTTLIIRDATRKVAACAVLAALGLFSAMGISEIGTVFYDNVTSLGILGTALLLVWRMNDILDGPLPRALGLAALCGVPAGFCVGLKMTCADFCAAECFALLVVSRVSKQGFLAAFAFGCGALAAYAATYLHWGLYLFAQYGNPFFPFFNNIFRAPLMPAESLGDYFVLGGSAKLLHPFTSVLDPYTANEILWKDWRVPVLYILLIIAALKSLLKGTKTDGGPLAQSRPALFLLWMGPAAYYAWISFEAVYRYLMPLDMLAPLMITACVGYLPGDLRTRWQTAAAALIVVAVTVQPGTWGRHAAWPERMASLSGAPLPDKPDTLVLMAGFDAYAYLVPQFPPQVAFLRIESRSFHPDDKLGINGVIAGKIDAHKGPLKLFMPARALATGRNALAHYGLKLSDKSCKTVKDDLYEAPLDKPEELNNAYPPAYSLCDVTRKSH